MTLDMPTLADLLFDISVTFFSRNFEQFEDRYVKHSFRILILFPVGFGWKGKKPQPMCIPVLMSKSQFRVT